jgi:hypothetical protein
MAKYLLKYIVSITRSADGLCNKICRTLFYFISFEMVSNYYLWNKYSEFLFKILRTSEIKA